MCYLSTLNELEGNLLVNKIIEILNENIHRLGFELKDEQIIAFDNYTQLLKAWNEKMNLTSMESDIEIAIKHFYDSLTLIPIIEDIGIKPISIMDVGTGAGFPGIPLAVIKPEMSVRLLETVKKRILFLDTVIESLKLEQVKAIWSRVEDIGQSSEYRNGFTVVTARAVAPLNILVEYCLPLTAINGYCILMKGSNFEKELKESRDAIDILGGQFSRCINSILPLNQGNRNIVIIKKIKETPMKYPRKAGIPKKRPL